MSMKEAEVAGGQGAAVVVTSVIVRVVLLVKEDIENATTTPIAALVKPVMLMVSWDLEAHMEISLCALTMAKGAHTREAVVEGGGLAAVVVDTVKEMNVPADASLIATAGQAEETSSRRDQVLAAATGDLK
jgi:hypothetical protein